MKKFGMVLGLLLIFPVIQSSIAVQDSNEELWVKVTSHSWQLDKPNRNYEEGANWTAFYIQANITFNNPANEIYVMTHLDTCGWKLRIQYLPHEAVENPLNGISFDEGPCGASVEDINYPPGQSIFPRSGAIYFPGELESLPIGTYNLTGDPNRFIELSEMANFTEEVQILDLLVRSDSIPTLIQTPIQSTHSELTQSILEPMSTGQTSLVQEASISTALGFYLVSLVCLVFRKGVKAIS